MFVCVCWGVTFGVPGVLHVTSVRCGVLEAELQLTVPSYPPSMNKYTKPGTHAHKHTYVCVCACTGEC